MMCASISQRQIKMLGTWGGGNFYTAPFHSDPVTIDIVIAWVERGILEPHFSQESPKFLKQKVTACRLGGGWVGWFH